MSASSALPETLKSITATKIEELHKQRRSYEAEKSSILRVAAQQKDLISKVSAILEGTCRIEGVHIGTDTESDDEDVSTTPTGDQLKNQRRFVQQARQDPSFASTIIKQFGEEVTRELELKSITHEHAQFFSELVTEWLSNPDGKAEKKEDAEDDSSIDSSSSFEDVGRKEMHEQRQQWESIVFSTPNLDEQNIDRYLKELFTSNKTVAKAFEVLQKSIRFFSTEIEYTTDLFKKDFLKTTIKGLLKTDLLSDEKNAILKTFLQNKEVLVEVADVLNMRMAQLGSWSWTTDSTKAIPLEMRKQLNGKYRVFMDEDVLDAILFHAIGLKWAVELKAVFTTFFNSFAWQRSSKYMAKVDRERREYYLGADQNLDNTVQSERRSMYAADYFMTQLPVTEKEGARSYDDDDSSDDDAGLGTVRKGPLETKHSLLHLLIAESQIATRLHGQFTVVRSDFKWFGPSLPHVSIYAVLRHFCVSNSWLGVFKHFLEAPMRFIQDGPQAQLQIRKRGVPMSHTLSDVFGECLLFVMDFAVNQATSGSYLYRLHDDFWFWGREETCRSAWKAMSDFAAVIGIDFNEEKTGTVRLGRRVSRIARAPPSRHGTEAESEDVSESEIEQSKPSGGSSSGVDNLPKGEIRWGFLKLDAASASFVIDQAMVDEHIKELQLQLSHCNSVFSYVQAYNAYFARFFSNNFGRPSYAFGRDHVDMMIETFVRIQGSVFPDGSVTNYLRSIIEQRFGVKDLPDGFFYWPVQKGGLELRNPFVPLFGMRESMRRTPARMLEKALDCDEAAYTAAKDKFEKENTGTGVGKYNWEIVRKIQESGEKFMPLEEYLRYREERSPFLYGVYKKLLEIPEEKEVAKTPQIASWLEGLRGGPSTGRGGSGIQKRFENMQPYWKWILAVHGGEIVKRYGNVQIVDQGRVPIGVVGVMRAGKVRWRG